MGYLEAYFWEKLKDVEDPAEQAKILYSLIPEAFKVLNNGNNLGDKKD